MVELPTDIAGSVCGQPIRKSWQNHDITSTHEPCHLPTAILHNLGHVLIEPCDASGVAK
jgi:hypothetical protein